MGPYTKVLHLAQIKEDLQRKELAECTFRPKINTKSKDMMKGRVGALRDRAGRRNTLHPTFLS